MISLNRIIFIAFVSVFIYICIPYILLKTNFDMWGSFSNNQIIYKENLISIFDIIYSFIILLIFLQFPNIYSLNNKIINNNILYIISLFLLIFYYQFSSEVINKFISSDLNRDIGAQLWLIYLNNGINSYLMTLALIFTVCANENKNYLFLYILVLILLSQLLSGMRSEFSRFIVILLAIINKKYFYIVLPIVIVLVINRQLLFNYDYDVRSIFGDAINVMYGYHLVNDINITKCNAYNSLLRIFVPPPMRNDFFEYSGDLVICLNVNYFEVIGIGNSIITDINKFSLETTIALILYIIIVYLFPSKYKYLITILSLSMVPHIMRLGIITSVSYTISFILWILIPVIIINEIYLKSK